MAFEAYTEEELQDVVNSMGLAANDRRAMAQLKKSIDQILSEELFGGNEVLEESMFSSLCVDDVPPLNRGSSGSDNYQACPSPIATRKRQGNGYRTTHISDADEDLYLDHPVENGSQMSQLEREVEETMSDAYRCIGRVYNTCRDLDSCIKAMQGMLSEDESVQSDRSSDKENASEGSDTAAPSEIGSEESSRKKLMEQLELRVVDPSIRPVLAPEPGRAPFKYDPVTRYHLYKEEWKRHPAPGEKKRLSLRWKVREYMLRQDMPRLVGRIDVMPRKDWSPRPYLD